MEQKKIDFSDDVNFKGEPNAAFRLKVTNLRKSAYPTNNLSESDYSNFKVGDFLTKGNSMTSIFEIVSIIREPITQNQYDTWNKQLHKYIGNGNTPSDKKAKDLIDEYKKNGNFGACQIKLKSVLRSDKRVAKGTIKKFLELDNAFMSRYRMRYNVVNLNDIVRYHDNSINRYTREANRLIAKGHRHGILKQAITDLQNEKLAAIATRIVQEAKEEVGLVEQVVQVAQAA